MKRINHLYESRIKISDKSLAPHLLSYFYYIKVTSKNPLTCHLGSAVIFLVYISKYTRLSFFCQFCNITQGKMSFRSCFMSIQRKFIDLISFV